VLDAGRRVFCGPVKGIDASADGIWRRRAFGAVFFDLLPESLAVAGQQGWSTRVVLAIVIGAFIFFYLIERFLVLHVHADDCDVESHRHLGRLSAIGLIAHSTLDGVAIGAASLVNWQTALIGRRAIIVHETPATV